MNRIHLVLAQLSAAAVLCLAGCSGGGGLLPLVGNLDDDLAAGRIDLLSFDETTLTGSPFSRDGTTREQAAIAAVDLGVKGINAFGRNLDSFSEGSAGISSFDSFVLVPVRTRTTLEVVDETVGDRRVRGTIRVEGERRLARLRSTGPGSELLLEQDDNPPQLTTQVTGYDTIAPFGKVTFRMLNEETVDSATNHRTGRLRAEIYRADGTLLYAADANHDGGYTSGPYTLGGSDIWFAADGFWVKGLADLQHVDTTSATGSVTWSASDGQQVDLNFETTGELNGTVTKDDEVVAELFLDRGRLILAPPGSQGVGGGATPLASFDLEVTPPAG